MKFKFAFKSFGLETREQRAWALYDWGNSAFATTIMAAILPIYFHDVAASTLAEHERSAYWGYAAAFSLFVAAVLSPALGALADVAGYKKRLTLIFTIFGALSCVGLYAVDRGDWPLAVVLYIIGNIGFSGAMVFYDALLPSVARTDELHRVSSAGYATGYLGGGILLALNLLWMTFPEMFLIPDKITAVKISFVSVGLWWIFFTIPLMRHVKEDKVDHQGSSTFQLLQMSVSRLKKTASEVKKYPQIWLFLLSFWLYSDGIGTIMKMATIYGREVGIGANHLIGALLLVQFVGIPATFLFGLVSDGVGPKKSLFICLAIYTAVCIIGFFMTKALHFWALAILVALVQGGSQAISRSIFALIVPKEQVSEYFAFMSVSSRFAGILGPFLFGIASQLSGSSKVSILLLVSFFIIGGALLLFLDIEKGQKDAALIP